MRTSKTGTWQTATILGLADTFPTAEWQSQLQVIARNPPEISIKVRFLQASIFWSSFIVLNSPNKNQKPLWGVSLCGSLFESHSQYAMGKPQTAFLNTSILSPYIHGIVKNTKKYGKWSLPTILYNLIGLNKAVHHSRLLWKLSILHVAHMQMHTKNHLSCLKRNNTDN